MKEEEFEKLWQEAKEGEKKLRQQYLQKFAKLSKEEQEKELIMANASHIWEDWTDGFMPFDSSEK